MAQLVLIFNFDFFCVVDGSENVTGLDLSEFPVLADRTRREGSGNPTPLINPLAGRTPYGKKPFKILLYLPLILL